MKKTTLSTIAMIALAVLAPADPAAPAADPAAKPAADAANGDVAKQLEKQAMGYWVPDGDAMVKQLTEKMGMKKEDAQAMVEESSKLTIHAEPGTVQLYTKQGIVSVAYEILAADKATGSLTLRQVNAAAAADRKPQPVKITIKDGQIAMEGGQAPFILKKIDEAEFTQRKNAVPADNVGP